MLIRTHLSITLFFVLLLLPVVEYQFIFFTVALVATFLPDVDSRFSRVGSKKVARVLQFFTRHRGIIHSFTFLIIATFFLTLFFPVVSLGFFLGYGTHLIADSFNVDGIRPFYPLKMKSSGWIKTTGKSETSVFVLFVILDLFLIAFSIF